MLSAITALPHRIRAARRLYYDATGVSPHSETTRDTYTLSSTEYGYVENICIYVRRNTAATTAGTFGAKVQFLIGATDIVLLGFAHSTSNTVGAYDKIQFAANLYLRPGDMIRITTFDTSSGGSCDYSVYVAFHTIA